MIDIAPVHRDAGRSSLQTVLSGLTARRLPVSQGSVTVKYYLLCGRVLDEK